MNHNLILIENGKLCTYQLDDRRTWEVGRPTSENSPDIKLHIPTASRRHGRFENMDGEWYYIDNYGKNGTVYNDEHLTAGKFGRAKPIMLEDGDVLIYGGGEEPVISARTIWSMYCTGDIDSDWKVQDTKGMGLLTFSDGMHSASYDHPKKGTVVHLENAMGIYMGDVTYLSGNIRLVRA